MTQRQNHNWILGDGVVLNFSTPNPTTSTTTSMNTFEGCACISDAAGNLLLYSDGQKVWDGSHTVRAVGLQGNTSSTQSAIILPNPANTNQYYVFTADGATGSNHHLDGILLDVTHWSNQVALSSILPILKDPAFTARKSPTEKVLAIQHLNCRDFWVLTVYQNAPLGAGNGLAGIRVFLVHSSGVNHVADFNLEVNVQDVGYLKASPDGMRIAMANWTNQNLLVFSFNPANGAIDTNPLIIQSPPVKPENHPRAVYGVEFSPDNRFLYYSVIGKIDTTPRSDGFVFQYDLNGTGPSVLVGTHKNAGGRYALGALQLGPDHRIYIAQDGERFLGVIQQPNQSGTSCQLQFNWLSLGKNSYMGLPNLIANLCTCPCPCSSCDVDVERANHILESRARALRFTVFNNGIQVPHSCGPAFKPQNFKLDFTFHWGDGRNDKLEVHDTEVVYICIRNPYSNLCFKGITITGIKIVPNFVLPNSEAALRLVPEEAACFDEIGPCASVCRDFTFLIRNALPQNYTITFEYCIEEVCILMEKKGKVAFTVSVVQS